MATRWGIVSAGKISFDFALALTTLPKEEHVAMAVAARDLRRAEDFARQLGIPRAYGSYEELAADPNIDVIYIGSINTEHLKLGELFMSAGKPVLCEKPLCMNLKEVRQLIEVAKAKRVFLMEAIWSRFNPIYIRVKEEIDAGTIGEVLQVQVNFGIQLEHKDRVTKKELGGSAILDIGVYTIQLATMVFGKPARVQATGGLNSEGVDNSMTALLTYPGDKVAVLQVHTRVNMVNEARIIGTKGTIHIPQPFWCPTEVTILDKHEAIALPMPSIKAEFKHTNSAALRFEAAEVRRCLQEGLTQSPVLPWSESIIIAEIEDEIRKQIGVVFKQD